MDRWELLRDGSRLLVSVDMASPLTDAETDTLATAVSSELGGHITEVLLLGPRPLQPESFGALYGVVKRLGTLVNDSGKAFKIAH